MTAGKGVRELVQQSVLALPTLPNVFVTVLEKITKDHTSADDIGRLIEKDQSLVSRILAVANSPAYGFRNEISTVPRAVALLGFDLIKNLVLSVSIFDDFLESKEIASFDKIKFWKHSLVCAAVSEEIARQMQLPCPDETYVVGLLHDVGKVVLDTAIKETYADILAKSSTNGTTPLSLERSQLGADHAQVAEMLSEKWTLPDNVMAPIRCHHDIPSTGLTERQEKISAIVAAADFLCWKHGFSSVESLHPPKLSDSIQKHIDIDKLDVDKICEVMDRQIMTTAELFDFTIPDATQFREALMKANVELGRINSLYEEAKIQLQRQVRELSSLNRAIYEVGQDLDVKATVRALLESIQNELGYSRALFFRVQDETDKIYLSDFVSDKDDKHNYADFGVELGKKDILSKSLAEKRIIRIHKAPDWENDPIFANLNTEELIVVPIPAKQGIIGIVTADNGRIPQAAYTCSAQSLNILAQEAGLAIENAVLFEKTSQLATRDGLTDLYNRRFCMQAINTEVERSKRYERPLSIILFDIDHFKNINDTFGHQVGDDVLRNVALVMVSCSRKPDITGRFGGEEFLVILPETNLDGAIIYGDRVRLAIEKFGKADTAGIPRTDVTISGGAVTYDPKWNTVETFLELTDQALYKAKRGGRNKIVPF